MDFTLTQYKQLLKALQSQGFSFQTFAAFVHPDSYLEPESKAIVLRHDVDKMPQNSLRFAQIQAALGIQGTYYFRMHKHSYNEKVIKEIAALGHEVGYHYETMDVVSSKLKVESSKLGSRAQRAERKRINL